MANKQTFKKGTLCCRCGIERKELGKHGSVCSNWGQSFPKHIWNQEDVTVPVMYMGIEKLADESK